MLNFFISMAIKFLNSCGYKVLSVEDHDDLIYTKGISESAKKFLEEFNSVIFVIGLAKPSTETNRLTDASVKLKDQLDRSFLDMELECIHVDNSSVPSQLKLGRQKGYSLIKNLKECFDYTLNFQMYLVKELKNANSDLRTSIGRIKQSKDELQKKLERLDPTAKTTKRRRRKSKSRSPVAHNHQE